MTERPLTQPEKFMKALANLCQPDRPVEALANLAGMLPMLETIPPRCWASRACLDAVATHKRRTVVPSYGDIIAACTAWCRENPDPALRIGDQRKARWSLMDHLWLKWFDREEFAQGRAHALSLLRAQAPSVWSFVTGVVEVEPGPPTPEAIAYVRGLVGTLGGTRRV